LVLKDTQAVCPWNFGVLQTEEVIKEMNN